MSIYKERPAGNCNVYLLTDPTGKPYSGYCTGPYKGRLRSGHGYAYNADLDYALKLYGKENFKVWLVVKDTSVDFAADKFEPWWIEKGNCLSPHGYNKTTGGRRNFKFCQESRDKMSAAHSKPVHQIDLKTGNIIATFPSIKAASEATGINADSIWKVVHGYRKKAGKFYWKFVE